MSKSPLFAFSYGPARPLFALLGMGPAFTGMQIDGDVFRVRFSWAFSARIPIQSITKLDYDHDYIGGIGVHGWKGTWLVNGSGRGMIALEIEPPPRAFVIGFPVRLRKLRVSSASPNQLLRTLRKVMAEH